MLEALGRREGCRISKWNVLTGAEAVREMAARFFDVLDPCGVSKIEVQPP